MAVSTGHAPSSCEEYLVPRTSDDEDDAFDDLPQWATGRLLSTAARLVEHAWDSHLATWGLNHASFAVLWTLERGAMTQRELAAAASVQDQTMSRVLERLDRLGYVSRERSPDDRRRVLVTLTPTGRRVRGEAHDERVAEGLLGDAVSDLPRLREDLVALVRHAQRAAGRRSTQA